MKILMFELVHSNLNSDGRFKFLLLLKAFFLFFLWLSIITILKFFFNR